MNAHMPIEPAPDSFDEIAAEVHAEEAARLKSRGASFEDVKAASLRSIDTVLGKYLPGGKHEANGKEYVVLNPARGDRKAGSFKINRHNGVWSDFSMGQSGGDMIDLVMYLTGRTNIEAKNELAELLGVQARSGSTDLTGNIRDTRPKQQKAGNIAATPLEASSAPAKFPPRTPPDDKGKPGFVVASNGGAVHHLDASAL